MVNSILLISSLGRVTGSLSILGSLSIMYMIISDRRRKLVQPFHRLMLLMSIFDVLHSVAIVVSTAAAPKESNVEGAIGNSYTCDIQGFFMVLGLAVPLYNSCLNTFFVLTIRYNVSSQQFRKFELVLDAIAILIPLSMASYFTARGYTVPTHIGLCSPDVETALWAIQSLLFFCFIICIVSMVCICWTVISQATKMEKYTNYSTKRNTSLRSSRVNDDKNRTIQQALFYTIAFILTYAFPIAAIFYRIGPKGAEMAPLAIRILFIIFYPLQGFWNFVFYVRPGVQYVIERSPDMSYLRATLEVILYPESTVSRRRKSGRRRSARRRRSSILRSTNRVTAASDPASSLFESNDSSFKEIFTKGLDDCTNSNEVGGVAVSVADLDVQIQQDAKIAEVEIMEEDIEESKLQLQPKIKPRRLSLVHIASVLCEDDYKYLDVPYNPDV